MTVRIAVTEDVPEIMELLNQVFCSEQGIPAEMNRIPEEKKPIWWVADDNGYIVACLASWVEDGVRHMGRFAVIPELRGKKIGAKLLDTALADILSGDCEEIRMEARDTTVHMLLQRGAEITGETFTFFGQNETPLVLRKQNWKHQ